MSINLMEMIGRELSGPMAGKIAAALGASPQAASTGIGAVVPALLGGMLSKTGTPSGASELVNMLTSGNHDGILSNLSGALGGGDATKNLMQQGSGLLSGLFGNRLNAVTGYISNAAGLNSTSSTSLLGLLAPVVFGFVTKHLRNSGGLNASSLTNLMAEQKSGLQAAAPPALTSALGLGTMQSTGPLPTSSAGSFNWLPWILGALALLAVLFLSRSCKTEEPAAPVVVTPAPAPAPVVEAPAPVAAADGLIDRKLADGTTIRIAADGVESKLLAFIEDPARAVDKTTWFSFDRLEFETGSATLKATSNAQLDNIAAIFKNYPKVALKLGGYTDNTGNKETNMKLSEARAKTVMAGVVSRGTAPDRLSAEGFGEQFPVADNATAEGRQHNRRVDVRVTAK